MSREKKYQRWNDWENNIFLKYLETTKSKNNGKRRTNFFVKMSEELQVKGVNKSSNQCKTHYQKYKIKMKESAQKDTPQVIPIAKKYVKLEEANVFP